MSGLMQLVLVPQELIISYLRKGDKSMSIQKLINKTVFIAITSLIALLLYPSLVLAASGYDVILVPEVRNNTWAQLGTVIGEAEPGALINGDLLMFRLSSNCKLYESAPLITGPVVSDTPSGQQITYNIAGDQNGQVRIVIPEWVRGDANDLFNAAGHDPFYINSLHNNEVVMVLQNYDSTFGENRFLIYLDEAYAVADEYRSVRLYFESMSGSGWPSSEVPVAGYDFVCPFAPADLKATAVSETQINLSWQDNAINEAGYIILIKQEGSDSHKELTRVGSNIVSYSLTDLSPDTSYSFLVQAFNSNCTSTPSNVTSARTLKPPQKIDELVFKLDNSTYYFNSEPYQLDATPIVKESRTLLPIRYIAEALGAQVEWTAEEKLVDIILDKTEIQLWIGNPTAKVNGINTMVDADNSLVVPEIIAPGRTMVPLRFVAEALGCTVDWDELSREIIITREIAE